MENIFIEWRQFEKPPKYRSLFKVPLITEDIIFFAYLLMSQLSMIEFEHLFIDWREFEKPDYK